MWTNGQSISQLAKLTWILSPCTFAPPPPHYTQLLVDACACHFGSQIFAVKYLKPVYAASRVNWLISVGLHFVMQMAPLYFSTYFMLNFCNFIFCSC